MQECNEPFTMQRMKNKSVYKIKTTKTRIKWECPKTPEVVKRIISSVKYNKVSYTLHKMRKGYMLENEQYPS